MAIVSGSWEGHQGVVYSGAFNRTGP